MMRTEIKILKNKVFKPGLSSIYFLKIKKKSNKKNRKKKTQEHGEAKSNFQAKRSLIYDDVIPFTYFQVGTKDPSLNFRLLLL